MTNDPTDWHQALAGVGGQLVRGEQRVGARRGPQQLHSMEKTPVS
jgi:hypothetical protein